MDEQITVRVQPRGPREIDITVYGDDAGSGPELIGYLSITTVPRGVIVYGTHGNDDSEAGQLILHAR